MGNSVEFVASLPREIRPTVREDARNATLDESSLAVGLVPQMTPRIAKPYEGSQTAR